MRGLCMWLAAPCAMWGRDRGELLIFSDRVNGPSDTSAEVLVVIFVWAVAKDSPRNAGR